MHLQQRQNRDIYTKALAQRLQSTFPEIINSMQTGFVKGRLLADNILKIQEAIDMCHHTKTNGILISFDFEKAFDTVEWPALWHALESFGFGEKFIDMIKVVFNQQETFVMNDGYWSQPIHPMRGCRQGCCLSAGSFNIVIELLGIAIQQNSSIKGFNVNETVIKAGQCADDLWTVSQAAVGEVNEILREIMSFSEYSGLKVNMDKCAVLRIGPWFDSDAKFYTLKWLFWSPTPIVILGISIYPNELIMYYENFANLLEKVDDIIGAWHNHNLTLVGKITVINSLINSLFIHKFMAIPSPPSDFFKAYERKVKNFLWGEKPHKVAYVKLIQKFEKLGLQLIDLEEKDTALKAAWPVRLNKRAQDNVKWFYNSLPIKDNRIWLCNTSAADVVKMGNISQYVKSIWAAWCKYNFNPDINTPEEILDTYLWGNSLIRKANKPIFDTKLVNSGIDKIRQLYNTQKKQLISHHALANQVNCNIDLLTYASVRASIPRIWKHLLQNHIIAEPTDLIPTVKRIENYHPISKKIYWDIIDRLYPPDLGAKIAWERDLMCQMTDQIWFEIFPKIRKLVKPTKLLDFQYRLLIRALTTNVRRSKWNKKISPYCTFCEEMLETMIHLLCNCKHVKILWKNLSKMCKYYFSLQITYTNPLIILNNYDSTNK